MYCHFSRIGLFSFVVLMCLWANVAFASTLEVLQFREVRHDEAPALQLRFSQPVSLAQVNENITLTQLEGNALLGERVEADWLIQEQGKVFIAPFVEPSKKYEVFVGSQLRAKSGVRLPQSVTMEVKTKRLSPAANFASNGFILSSANDKGLPITSVNVDAVDIDFFRVEPDQYQTFFQSRIQNGENSLYRMESLHQFAQLVHTSRFDIKNNKNQRTYANLSIDNISALQGAGLYVAVMRKAGVYEYDKNVIYFTVSNLGLHLRRYQQQISVHILDLESHQAFSDVEVTLYDKSGQVVVRDTTDSRGLVDLVGVFPNAQYLTAQFEQQLSVLKFANANLDLSDFQNAISLHQDIQAFAYGPRDIFRPGEEAIVQILLRDYDGVKIQDLPLGVKLFRPDNKLVLETQLQPQASGYYEFRYDTGSGAQTGQWRVKFVVAEQELNQSYGFKVEEFRPNRLELNVFDNEPGKRLEVFQPNLAIPVSGKYLFGAPAAGNEVDAIVKAKLDPHPFEAFGLHYFGDDQEKVRYPTRRLLSIQLDEQGNGILNLRNPWQRVKSPLKLMIDASLYEAGGKPVVSKDAITLLNNNLLLGIRPLFSGEPDKNTAVKFNLIALEGDGEARGSEQLDIELIREDRNYYWAYSSHRGWYYEHDAQPYQAWSQSVSTDISGAVDISVPLEFGHYQLVVRDANKKALSRYSFKTAGRWWQNTVGGKNKPQNIMMAFDKSEFQRGDTVNVEFVSPHSGTAYVTVENNAGVLSQTQFPVTEGKNITSFVISDDWRRHDYYVTALVVNDDLNQNITPSRAFGLKHLPVRRQDAKLDVSIRAQEKSRPLQTLSAEIQVSNHNPELDTFVTVALVDVGILNITKFKTPMPEQYLLAPRRYDVDVYDVYDKLIVANQGPSVAQSFGGDLVSSDEELSRGAKRPDADVKLVSFLTSPIAVDQQGIAKVNFDIPDFDGRLKWMVVAFNDSQYGQVEHYSQIASPVTAQLSIPPFFAFGDESEMILEVHNLLDREQTVAIKLASSEGVDAVSIDNQLALSPKSKRQITVPLKVGFDSESASFSLQLESFDKQEPVRLNRHYRVPIRSPYPAQTTRVDIELEPGQQLEMQADLSALIPSQTQAQLVLSSIPPIDYASHLQFLLRYPYGCLEQVTSTSAPWLTVNQQTVTRFGLEKNIEDKFGEGFSPNLKANMLQQGITKLGMKQRSDGSFAMWGADGEMASWLTVYATDFLLSAAEQGAQVDTVMLRKATKHLKNFVKRSASVRGGSWSRNKKHYEFSVRAYAAFVLASHNQVSLSDVRRLKKDAEKASSISTLPWVHLALAFEQLGAKNDTKRILNKLTTFRREPGYLGDYGSNVRDLAWILALKQEFNLALPYKLNDLFYELRGRRWLSTQERSQLLKLATLSGENSQQLHAILDFVDGDQQALNETGQFSALMNYQQLNNLQQVTSEKGNIYGSLTIVGSSNDSPLAKQEDFSIRKTYYDLNGMERALSDVESGELLVVEIKVSSEEGTPDAMIIDLLPAGFAIENQNLADASVDLSNIVINGELISTKSTYLQHEEFREDRYVAAIKLWKYSEETLYYLVRATTPGKYTVPPVFVEDMFKPSLFGLGITKTLNVK